MRVACVDIPALPLQLVWRRQPSWRSLPTVVVDEDRPQGTVLVASEAARAQRVLPGQRYASALALAPGLRAAVVPSEELAAARDEVARRLHALSPEVTRDEPEGQRGGREAGREAGREGGREGAGAAGGVGTFWLGGAGMSALYPSATAWGQAAVAVLAALGLGGVVVVGFSRFATCAVARARGHGLAVERAATLLHVFARDLDERTAARAVPLDRLDIDPVLRDALARLGVHTLGELVRLPGGGVLERFGTAAHRLYRLAAGEGWDPLAPEPPPEALDERVHLDEPELDAERLVFASKAALDRLLVRLADRRRALTALYLELTLRVYGDPGGGAASRHQRRVDCIKPAAPTLDGRSLLGLLRLRLEHQPPDSGVAGIRVWADDVAATREQLALFAEKPRRDLRAADTALARLRAELGDDAVVRAVLRPGHLPEARFGWERLDAVVAPRPRTDRPRLLVRRVLARPLLLPPQPPSVRDDGWVLSGLAHGTVTRIVGPYILSGGWWSGEIHREYHFAETRRGDCLWLYYDRARRRWYQHGAVE
jgi:protein ImuB